MKKKGSLSLSVNAIVVLILAIVMLGLGLGFIRGMFGKVSTQVEQQISSEREPAIPTASQPLTLSREMIITLSDQDQVVKASLFNPTNAVITAIPSVTCSALAVTEKANERTINQGEFKTYDILLDIPVSAPTTDLCEITIDAYKKDITIKITE